MAEPIPTRAGDVLILRTEKSFVLNAIGRVSQDGQQDLEGERHVKYERRHASAVAAAKTLVAPGGRIFLVDIDRDVWSEIPTDA